jgi:uncharacterized protein YbjT (DUF2867 family)
MILVVGATGALGGMVARNLLAEGAAVRVLVRPGSDYSGLVAAGAQPVMGDLKDRASLDRACAGVATVVTTANSAGRGGADTVDTVERSGNRALIDAARDAGVRHFVFVSALGSAADSPVDFLRGKAESEAHLRASGMSYTVVQPNIFMEGWFGMLIGMPLQQGRAIRLVEPARSRHTFVSIVDVAALVTAAAKRAEGRNEELVIGGPAALSWRDVVATAEDVLGRQLDVEYVAPGTPFEGLPPTVAQLAAGFETYETAFDAASVASAFGVRLTPASECLERLLQPPLPA